MSIQYGRPIYDGQGNVIGYTADHDGDGTYDVVIPVVSDPINSGEGFTTHVADHDGDGTYDDHTIFITDHDQGQSNPHTPEKDSSPYQKAIQYGNLGYATKKVSKKTLKVILIIAAILLGYSLLSGIGTFVLAVVYKLFAGW